MNCPNFRRKEGFRVRKGSPSVCFGVCVCALHDLTTVHQSTQIHTSTSTKKANNAIKTTLSCRYNSKQQQQQPQHIGQPANVPSTKRDLEQENLRARTTLSAHESESTTLSIMSTTPYDAINDNSKQSQQQLAVVYALCMRLQLQTEKCCFTHTSTTRYYLCVVWTAMCKQCVQTMHTYVLYYLRLIYKLMQHNMRCYLDCCSAC